MDTLLIRDGVVDNVIAADSVARAQEFNPECACLERTPALAHIGPGWLYDGTVFSSPPPVSVDKQPVTRLEFMRRFSMAKRIQLRTVAKTDPVIADALAMLDAAQEVRLDHADTVMFIGYLQQQGLLTIQEVASVLA